MAETPKRTDDALNRMNRNWHTNVTHMWTMTGAGRLPVNVGSVEKITSDLAAIYEAQRGKQLNSWDVKRHVLRKLALDVMCASFPAGHPPPESLISLMKLALDLPQSHEVGYWAVIAGQHDDRGGAEHEMRTTAMLIDSDHLQEHEDYMPVRRLAKLVKEQLGRAPDRKSLRKWRDEPDYSPIWKRRPSGKDE